ncbi:MAG TPA: NAD(P)/FAD-dependent oxidoreductase, partial [Caulobacteraceae bacterium]
MTQSVDCLIVGGGPAGLTAAVYVARFRLSVVVIDAGDSRAAQIPCTRNQACFPEGISGRDLLDRMRQHAIRSGARLERGVVTGLTIDGDAFAVAASGGARVARAVLLATGLSNRRPPMSDDVHAAALAAGRLRYCPVCDGFEVSDQNVAVIGTGEHGVKEALFLRSYTDRVTMISPGATHDLTAAQVKRLDEASVVVLDGPVREIALEGEGLGFVCGVGRRSFEAVYPAMGSVVHSRLAAAVGAGLTDDGCIKVDAHQRTSITGLYAAGDL